jgi:Tfp pilus assembly protein PilF
MIVRRDGYLCAGWLAGLLVLAAGCGGQTEANVPEAAQHLIEARQAMADGDTAQALAALDASIASEPNSWAYLERAKIRAAQGDDQAAEADCQALLALEPENRDVAWIRGELKKPVAGRFQGKFAYPPSASK